MKIGFACECGCGEPVGPDSRGRPRRFVHGHNGRGTGRHWSEFIIVAPSGHWVWVGGRSTCGYGRYRRPGEKRQMQASRAVYEDLVGPIAEDLDLDHLCRYTRCVNPLHLQPVTHAENLRRGAVGGRFRPGNKAWRRRRAEREKVAA